MLPTGFFVVEAKPQGSKPIYVHLPQAVSELYACATLLKYGFIQFSHFGIQRLQPAVPTRSLDKRTCVALHNHTRQ